jgi:hypothetical protein
MPEAELIITLPSKGRFHVLVWSLVVTGDIIIVGGGGAGSVGGATTFELVQDYLSNGLSHGHAGATHLPFAEVVAPRFKVVVLDLSIFEG